jgi:hypothetical protein
MFVGICKYYAILYKRLDCPWILESTRHLGISPLGYQRITVQCQVAMKAMKENTTGLGDGSRKGLCITQIFSTVGQDVSIQEVSMGREEKNVQPLGHVSV